MVSILLRSRHAFWKWKPIHRLVLSLLLILFACGPANAKGVSSHAKKAVEIIQELRTIGVPNDPSHCEPPPAQVPFLLKNLNRELKELIVEILNDPSRRHEVPKGAEVLEELRAAGWKEIPSNKWGAYGEIRDIKFDWQPEHEPDLLLISTQLWLPSETSDPDSAIHIFQGNGRNWKRMLSTDADFDPSGQPDSRGMQYQLSKPDSDGRWYLLIAQIPPACGRDRNVLKYKALRESGDPDKPTVLVSKWGRLGGQFDPAFEIRTDRFWFAITSAVERKIDGESGVAITRYEVGGKRVSRVQPLALSPIDFFDQWIQLPWEEAAGWSNVEKQPLLREWHSRFSDILPKAGEVDSLRKCNGEPHGDEDWMMELSVDLRTASFQGEQSVFIELAKKNGNFLVNGIYDRHPDRCEGRTPPKPTTNYMLPSW